MIYFIISQYFDSLNHLIHFLKYIHHHSSFLLSSLISFLHICFLIVDLNIWRIRPSLLSSAPGVWYSVLTGICVGVGTLFFFLLFQKGGPLSSVPMILAGGAALMAIAGIIFFKEPASWPRLLGIALSIIGLFLLRSPAGK